jgi:DivIVA domain-containing protein
VVTLLGVLGVVIALFGAGVLATRSDAVLREAPADVADVELPDVLVAEDLRRVRFGLVVRGYRMSEVDDVLDKAAAALAARDARIAELERRPAGPAGPAGPAAVVPQD